MSSFGETMDWLHAKLHDQDYDVVDHFQKVHDALNACQAVIDDREALNGRPTKETLEARGRWYNLFIQYLVRLRNASPHLYHCETLGWDQLHDDLEKHWAKKGLVDDEGFHWMMPRIFGPYNMRNR